MNNKSSEKIIPELEQLGLSQKESRVYLAAVSVGGGKASEIAKIAGTDRSNTYFVLQKLVRKGFMSQSEKNNLVIFLPTKPERLYSKTLERATKIKNIIPEIENISRQSLRPSVNFYEGRAGIELIFDEIIAVMLKLEKEKREVLSFLSPNFTFTQLQELQLNFMRCCKRNKIRFRWICPKTKLAQDYFQPLAEDYYYDIRFVPELDYRVKTEIDIFAGRIALISANDNVGTIIDNQDIAETQKELFELAWSAAEKVVS